MNIQLTPTNPATLGPKKSGWNKEVAGSQGYLVNPAALKKDQISWNREKNGMVTNSLCMCLPAFSNLHVYGYIIQL